MNRCAILLTFGLLAGVASMNAQGVGLSGKWVLIHRDDLRNEPLGPFGEVFVATHSSTALTIEWHGITPAGRGMGPNLVYRPGRSTFPFDGAESNVTVRAANRRIVTRVFDSATWSNGSLVITTTRGGGNDPPHVTRIRHISLEPNGILVVKTSTRPNQAGEPWAMVESRYRRVDQ